MNLPPRGYLMLLALVFGAIFVTVLGALAGSTLSQNRAQIESIGRSEGVDIAEAGLEYYRWHLSHFPSDLQNGTGHAGPYTISYADPETGAVTGTNTLTIVGNTACGTVKSIDITSKGTPSDGSSASATLFARYAAPSVALYSYILNSTVWAGADRVISGPYHSNGGVRMDGTANSPVTSSLSSWLCTTSFGCDGTGSNPPANSTQNGVFGSGPNKTLWTYPSPQVDFAAIAANFATLKATAQSSGLYFPRISSGTTGNNANRGYHLIFNSNGTVTVKQVTTETNVPSIPVDNQTVTKPQADYTLISAETTLGTYTLPATCGLVYVEDNTWVEGVIPSEVTVVAANVVTSGVTPNVMLPNNITYSNVSGVSGLTVISANDVLITPNSPMNMTLNGVFIAQGGAFGRNYYGLDSTGSYYTCPNSYEPRGTLTIHGTTVSNSRTGTKWSNGCPSGSAGYQTRIDAFDRQLSTNPPVFTPTTSTTFQFIDWRQQ